MNASGAKATTTASKEVKEDYIVLRSSVKSTIREAKSSKEQLWREGKKPTLIKVGLALIAFPDPTISDVVGGFLVAAGTVQEAVRRRSLYMEDVPKTLKNVLKDLQSTKEIL
jgi:hypothetical protein